MPELETSSSVTVHPSAGSVLAFGRFHFDRTNQILWRDGDEVKLPPRALAVLDLLLERSGSVVSKRMLLDRVWKDTHVTETSLTEAVSLLRQALGDDPLRPTYVLTVHRRGYRFVAPVAVSGPPGSTVAPTASAPRSDPAAGAPAGPAGGLPGTRRPVPPAAVWATATSALLIVLTALWWAQHRGQPPQPPVRLSIELPSGVSLNPSSPSLALDRTGSVLVFAGHTAPDRSRLYRRRLDAFEARPIPGTEGARAPFFSPDGRQLGFVADGQLLRIPAAGGVGVPLCRVSKRFGASWSEDGSIVFAGADSGGLSQIGAAGGEVRTLTRPRATLGEVGHWWPKVLPGGDAVIYTIWSTTIATAKVAVLSLATGESRVLLEGASNARYVAPGFLVFAGDRGVLAAPFDLSDLELTGRPFEVGDQAAVHPMIGLLQLEVAGDGTMAFLPPVPTGGARELALLDGTGAGQALSTGAFLLRNMDVDPTGLKLAVTVLDGVRSDVWVSPLPQPSLSRLTFAGFNIEPRWSPDGRFVAFASNRNGPFNLYRKPADGGETAERLVESELHQYPQAWSADGRALLYAEAHPETGLDLWTLAVDAPGRPRTPFLRTAHDEIEAVLSPDGRWVAYESDETGDWEVYLRSFPDGNGPWQASEHGGSQPFWSPDGSTLYYSDSPHLVALDVDGRQGLRLGSRRIPFDRDGLERICPLPPGLRFLAIREQEQDPELSEIRVVLGWSAGLAR